MTFSAPPSVKEASICFKIYLFAFPNTDTSYLPSPLAFALSVIINSDFFRVLGQKGGRVKEGKCKAPSSQEEEKEEFETGTGVETWNKAIMD